MAAHAEWYFGDTTCVIIRMVDPMTWDEFHRVIKQAHTAIRTVNHAVDLLIVADAPLPEGNALIHFRTAFRTQPRNVGKVVVVHGSLTVRLMALWQQLMGMTRTLRPVQDNLTFTRTLEDAHAILRLPNHAAAR